MPDKKVFTEEQLVQMIEDYYSNGAAKCPYCSIKTEPIVTQAVRIPKQLSFVCTTCKVTGGKQDDKYYNQATWTMEQKKSIEESYWKNKLAKCPIDGSMLKIDERAFMGPNKPCLSVLCFRCGNTLDTKK